MFQIGILAKYPGFGHKWTTVLHKQLTGDTALELWRQDRQGERHTALALTDTEKAPNLIRVISPEPFIITVNVIIIIQWAVVTVVLVLSSNCGWNKSAEHDLRVNLIKKNQSLKYTDRFLGTKGQDTRLCFCVIFSHQFKTNRTINEAKRRSLQFKKKFIPIVLFHFYFLFQAVFYAINIFYSILIFVFCFFFIPTCYSIPIDWFLRCGSTFNDQPRAKVRSRVTD